MMQPTPVNAGQAVHQRLGEERVGFSAVGVRGLQQLLLQGGQQGRHRIGTKRVLRARVTKAS